MKTNPPIESDSVEGEEGEIFLKEKAVLKDRLLSRVTLSVVKTLSPAPPTLSNRMALSSGASVQLQVVRTVEIIIADTDGRRAFGSISF